MAQVLIKEAADLGFCIAFRFYGRYPETGPRFYHPPSTSNGSAGEGDNCRNSNYVRSSRRPSLLILPALTAPSLSQFFASQSTDGVLPSPAALSVGAH